MSKEHVVEDIYLIIIIIMSFLSQFAFLFCNRQSKYYGYVSSYYWCLYIKDERTNYESGEKALKK